MGWYEALKDGISVAQKADNLQLVRDLLEAQQQIFDLVNENNQLKEEIKRLNEVVDIGIDEYLEDAKPLDIEFDF